MSFRKSAFPCDPRSPTKFTTFSAGAIGSAPTAPPSSSSTADWLAQANGNKRVARVCRKILQNVNRNSGPNNSEKNYMSYKSRFEPDRIVRRRTDAIIAVWLHGLRQNEAEE